ncbi:hypothetical protein [Pseudomonas gozinkensis]|uniref:hypothetical protein n=1 Tax=Pseudomonas gozinkensis TaxID=2774461 RepID=UPI001787E4A8|nr:hypothetical protein [Pseudomonas gozinkensis]
MVESSDMLKLFIPYILGTGLLTVIITLSVDKTFLLINNRKEKKHSSIRVAVILESYALTCSDFISGNEYFGQRYGLNEKSYDMTNGDRPVLQNFPTDINWKEIKPSLASRALSLNAEELMTNSLLSSLTDDEFGWDRLAEVHKIVGYNGYKAWMLANEFRADVSLPRAETLHLEKYVEKHLNRYHEKSIKEANMRHSFSID